MNQDEILVEAIKIAMQNNEQKALVAQNQLDAPPALNVVQFLFAMDPVINASTVAQRAGAVDHKCNRFVMLIFTGKETFPVSLRLFIILSFGVISAGSHNLLKFI